MSGIILHTVTTQYSYCAATVKLQESYRKGLHPNAMREIAMISMRAKEGNISESDNKERDSSAAIMIMIAACRRNRFLAAVSTCSDACQMLRHTGCCHTGPIGDAVVYRLVDLCHPAVFSTKAYCLCIVHIRRKGCFRPGFVKGLVLSPSGCHD